jgi:hypothetical protein
MFTWGPAIGVGVVLASRLFVGGGLAGWTRRLYVVWGILAIAGWSLTVLDSVISGALPALAAIASVVRIVSYVFPAVALAVTAWLLRDSARAPRRLQARPASG